jgi:hypothetical protein
MVYNRFERSTFSSLRLCRRYLTSNCELCLTLEAVQVGIVRMGPPSDLIMILKQRYGISELYETGTYYGDTTVWAARHFAKVVTIECSTEIYRTTLAKYGDLHNVKFIYGDSRIRLNQIVSEITSPAIFWLDSHFCGGETYGSEDECPLIEEMLAINKSSFEHFLFIDDARCFLLPPPRPHHLEQWPSIDKVIQVILSANHKYYVVIIEDVIVAVPEYAKSVVAEYSQEVSTKAWDEHGKLAEASEGGRLQQAASMIGMGAKVLVREAYSELRKRVFQLLERKQS